MSRTHRLLQLMQSLRRHTPPITAQALADDTGVSLRTLYRDIDALRGMGAIIDGTAGYGYALIEDAALPPMMFDDEEIEALVLGLRDVQAIADPALAEAAKNALAKIQARLPSQQAHRLKHAVLTATRFASKSQPTIDVRALRQATWDERSVQIGYCDLIAWCHLRQDYRNFRLDRISSMTVTEASFRPRRIPMLREAIKALAASPPPPQLQ